MLHQNTNGKCFFSFFFCSEKCHLKRYTSSISLLFSHFIHVLIVFHAHSLGQARGSVGLSKKKKRKHGSVGRANPRTQQPASSRFQSPARTRLDCDRNHASRMPHPPGRCPRFFPFTHTHAAAHRINTHPKKGNPTTSPPPPLSPSPSAPIRNLRPHPVPHQNPSAYLRRRRHEGKGRRLQQG